MTILRKKYNLCSFLEQSGSSCPLSKGIVTLTWGTTIPSSLPPVSICHAHTRTQTHTHTHTHTHKQCFHLLTQTQWVTTAHGTILLNTDTKWTSHLPFMDNVHRSFNYSFATFVRTLSFFLLFYFSLCRVNTLVL